MLILFSKAGMLLQGEENSQHDFIPKGNSITGAAANPREVSSKSKTQHVDDAVKPSIKNWAVPQTGLTMASERDISSHNPLFDFDESDDEVVVMPGSLTGDGGGSERAVGAGLRSSNSKAVHKVKRYKRVFCCAQPAVK